MILALSKAGINASVVLVYLALVVAIGIYFSRYIKKGEDFFLAGRSLNMWTIAGMIMATNVAAIYLIGPAEAAKGGGGFSVLLIAWTGNMIAAGSALFFVPRLRRLRITTISEFVETRYGLALRLLIAGWWIIFYALFAGNAMYTLSKAIQPVLDIPQAHIIWYVAGGVILYCVFSGLMAASYTAVIQCFIMVVGGLILLPLCLKHPSVGGISGFVSRVPESYFVFWKSGGTVWPQIDSIIMFILLGLPYWCTSQYMLQCSFGGKSVRHASRGLILAGLFTGFLTLSYIIPSICGQLILTGENAVPEGQYVLPTLITTILPVGLGGLIIAGLVAASNSTAGALLNALATLFEHDFFRRMMPSRSPKTYVWVGRVFIVLGGLVGVLFAFNVERLGGIIQANFDIMSVFEPPIFIIVAAALFWRRTNGLGAAIAMIGGILFGGLAFLVTFPLVKDAFPAFAQTFDFLALTTAQRTFISFPLCAGLLVFGSLLRRESPERQRVIDDLLSRTRGLRINFASLPGWIGVVAAVAALTAFVLCAVFEEALPKPANLFIFMGLMVAFVLACFVAVPMFVPDEREGEDADAPPLTGLRKVLSSGWAWLAMYVFAAVLVVVLYLI